MRRALLQLDRYACPRTLAFATALVACSDGLGFRSEVEISLPPGDVVYLDGKRVEPVAEVSPSLRNYVLSKEFDCYQEAEGKRLVIEVVRNGATVGMLRHSAQWACHFECPDGGVSRTVVGLQTDPPDWDSVRVQRIDCYDECGELCDPVYTDP